MLHRFVQIHINLAALRANVRLIQEMAGSANLWAIVKANAYGHGLVQVAETVMDAGAHGLAVVWLEDAIKLREHGIAGPILLMGGPLGATRSLLQQLQVIPVLSRWEDFAQLQLASGPSPLPVHLELDTGMSRLGFGLAELPQVMAALAANGSLQLTGIMSHYLAADEPAHPSLALQQAQWQQALQTLGPLFNQQYPPPHTHFANSPALCTANHLQSNQIRCGIFLYGINPIPKLPQPRLEPALSWHTAIFRLTTIPAGASVGYGASWVASKPSRIATLPLGYGDGYPRHLSNRGHVLIQGCLAPIVGRICMDMLMVDVTHIPAAYVGMPVILLGRQGEIHIDAQQLADWAGTIPYEIISRIPPHLPRHYDGSNGPLTQSPYQ